MRMNLIHLDADVVLMTQASPHTNDVHFFKLPRTQLPSSCSSTQFGCPSSISANEQVSTSTATFIFFSLSSVECRNSVSSSLHCDFLETETTTLILLFSSYEFPQFWPSTLIFCWCPSNICWHFCLYSAHVPFRVLLNASVVLVFLTPRLHRPDAGSSCLIKLAVEIIHKFSQTYRKNRMGEEVSNKKITVSLSNLVTFQTLLHDQISLTIDLNFNRSLENV